MPLAKLHHETGALYAQFCFERAGPIVNPCVNDTAVVGALVSTDSGFLLHDGNRQTRLVPNQRQAGRQSDDAPADNRYVVSSHRVSLPRLSNGLSNFRSSLRGIQDH